MLGVQRDGVYVVVVNNFFHGHNGLLGECLVFKHCGRLSVLDILPNGGCKGEIVLEPARRTLGKCLQNANSSRVRLEVSGNKNHTKTISKASQQQYVISHFQPMFCRPMGLTNVVKKLAPRPKNWKTAIPRDLSAYGHISTI